jgi:hypothetical protein
MKRLKTIRIVRLDLWPDRYAEEPLADISADYSSDRNELDLWRHHEPVERVVATSPDDGSDRKNEGDKGPPFHLSAGDKVTEAALLLKETDEINNWARLGSHLYFGLFTVLLIVNGIAIAWLSTSNRASVFFMFILFNLIGALATILVVKYLLQCDRRIEELIGILSRHHETKDSWSGPKSAIPKQEVKILFGFAAFALVVLLIFWTVLFVTAS